MSILHDALKRLDKKGKKTPGQESAQEPAVDVGTSSASVPDQNAAEAASEFAPTVVDHGLDHPTELDVTIVDSASNEFRAGLQGADELEMSSTRRDIQPDEMSGLGETVFMHDTSYLHKKATVADTLSENSFVLLALVLMLMSVGVLIYYFTDDTVFDSDSGSNSLEIVQREQVVSQPAVVMPDRPVAPVAQEKPESPAPSSPAAEPSNESQSVAGLTEGSNESPTLLVEADDVEKQDDVTTVDTESSVQAVAEDVADLTAGTGSSTGAASAQSDESTEVSRLTEQTSDSTSTDVSEDVALLTRDVKPAIVEQPTSVPMSTNAKSVVAAKPEPAADSGEVKGAVDRINASLSFSEQAQLSEQRFHLRNAYEMYRKAYSADPSNPQFLTDLGRITAKLNDYEDSRRWINRIPRSERGWEQAFWLGFGYLNEQKPELAIEHFEEATRSDPQQAAAWLYLGLAQQQLGQFNQSIDSFHSARAMTPDLPEIAYNTGISWMALGQKPKARAAFEHFLKETEQNPSYYVNQRERVIRQYLR